MKSFLDFSSLFVVSLTLVLFGVALVEKGFTHEILLEAGVFLVSVKLIMMSYKNSIATNRLQKSVDEILAAQRR